MNILRLTAVWSGFPGSPGYSAFHFSSDAGFWDGGLFGDEARIAANSAASRVMDAFDEINSLIPGPFTIRIASEAAVINSDTGEQLGAIDLDSASMTGNSTRTRWSGPTGAVVNWNTADYRFGRRIRGRTFLVPIAQEAYDEDGTLTSDALQRLRNFGSTMVAGGSDPEFGVWSRPRDGSGGVFATVTSSSVPDMAAVLRSRRD